MELKAQAHGERQGVQRMGAKRMGASLRLDALHGALAPYFLALEAQHVKAAVRP